MSEGQKDDEILTILTIFNDVSITKGLHKLLEYSIYSLKKYFFYWYKAIKVCYERVSEGQPGL